MNRFFRLPALSATLRLEWKLLFSRKDHLPRERALLKGRHISQCKLPSILFFTVHKAASAYVNTILSDLACESGRVPIDLSEYLVRQNLNTLNREQCSRYLKAFHETGYYYGAFRRGHGLPRLDHYRVLLQLRDPRDALTSHYFSRRYSHVVHNPQYAALREEAEEMDIDTFVLKELPKRKASYEHYIRELLPRPNVFFMKYEDMVTSFKPWFEKLTAYLEIEPSPELRQNLLQKADFTVEKEDIYSHKRQVTPGDHLRKLKPETIAVLNREFAGVLKQLQYPL